MHFSTVALTLFGAVASASASSIFARQATLPDCAINCTANANLGGCIVSDTHCLCTNAQFVSSTTTCIEAACSGSDLQQALAYSQGLCLKVGVTLTAPSSTSAAPSATSGASNSSSPSQTSPAASTTPTSPSGSSSGSGASPSGSSSSSAASHGVNAVFFLAAIGMLSLAL